MINRLADTPQFIEDLEITKDQYNGGVEIEPLLIVNPEYVRLQEELEPLMRNKEYAGDWRMTEKVTKVDEFNWGKDNIVAVGIDI